MSNDYPRMLYRPGKGPGGIVWGYRIDTLTVQSGDEERTAVGNGWFVDPKRAVKGAVRRQRLAKAWRFYLKNWQWVWGTAIAVTIAALFHG